jgi:hypothetical protein
MVQTKIVTFILMTEPTQYPYSLNFSLGSILLMIILMLLLFRNVAAVNSTVGWIIYGICAIIFLFLVTLLIIKRLIPALKGDIALEIDEQGVNDYIRDISIGWKDIDKITLLHGRSASTMLIDLKWESDYGKQVGILLRWVKGKDAEIYETTLAYFEQAGGNI